MQRRSLSSSPGHTHLNEDIPVARPSLTVQRQLLQPAPDILPEEIESDGNNNGSTNRRAKQRPESRRVCRATYYSSKILASTNDSPPQIQTQISNFLQNRHLRLIYREFSTISLRSITDLLPVKLNVLKFISRFRGKRTFDFNRA